MRTRTREEIRLINQEAKVNRLKAECDRLRRSIEIAEGHLDRAMEGLEEEPWVEAAQAELRRALRPKGRDG